MISGTPAQYEAQDPIGLQLIKGSYKGQYVDATVVRKLESGRYVVLVEKSPLAVRAGLVGRELSGVPGFVMRKRLPTSPMAPPPRPPPPATSSESKIRSKTPPPPKAGSPPSPSVKEHSRRTSDDLSVASSTTFGSPMGRNTPISSSETSSATASMEDIGMLNGQPVLTSDQLRKVQAKFDKFKRERIRRSKALLKVQKKNGELQVRVDSLTTAIEMCSAKISNLRSKCQKRENEIQNLREENKLMRSQISFLLTQTGDETANSRRDSKAQRAIDEIRAKMAPPGTIKSDKNDIGGDEATMTPEESTADAAGDVVAVPRPNDDDDDNDEDSKNRTDLNNDNDDGDEDKLRKNKGCNDEKTKDSTSSSSRNSNNTNTGSGITTNNTEKKKESNSNEPLATKEEGGGGSTVDELPNQTDNSEPYVLKEGFLRIETELKESTRYFRIQEKPASPTYLLVTN